jgi:uncharacterized delta-60 repeat protein
MGKRAARVFFAAACALASWGCFLALDFDGYDSNEPSPTNPPALEGSVQGSFDVSATPTSVTLTPGGPPAKITVAVERRGGFVATVALAGVGVPPLLTTSLGETTIAPEATTAALTVAVPAIPPPRFGRYSLTLRATAGDERHDVTIDVVVRGVPGELDSSFGDGGIVTTAFSAGARPRDMIIASDDRIILGGSVDGVDGGPSSFALARYTAEGAPDPTFASGGKVATALPNDTSASILGLAALPGLDVIAAGTNASATTVFVVRYRVDGTLEPSFGAQGIATIARNLLVTAAMRRPSGKIVLAGSAADGRAALLQLQPSGAIDTAFADAGSATHAAPASGSNAAALAPDGTVVAGGGKACGSLVFAADGSSVFDPDAGPEPFDICIVDHISIDDAGARLLAGSSRLLFGGAEAHLRAALELPDGGSPPGFKPLLVSEASGATGAAFDAEGRLLAAATPFGVVRARRDGLLDTTFFGKGFVQTAVGEEASSSRVGVQRDGRIVVSGSARFGGVERFMLARYWP